MMLEVRDKGAGKHEAASEAGVFEMKDQQYMECRHNVRRRRRDMDVTMVTGQDTPSYILEEIIIC
jgi:hypothetical protein